MAKPEYATHRREVPDKFGPGGWTTKVTHRTVRVMARAEGYAMVRVPNCMPFIVRLKELDLLPASTDSLGAEGRS